MKRFIEPTIVCILLCLFTFLLTTSKVDAISLSFEPSSATVNVGDSLSIDILISDLFTDNLAEFDFNINYDDSILGFNSYLLGSELGDIGAGDASDWSFGDLGGGTINLAEISWLWDFSSQPDSFTLASVEFSILNPGNTNLTFSNVILGNEWSDPLTATLENGSVTAAAPVPEPATIFLMGIGLSGIIGLKYRHKKC